MLKGHRSLRSVVIASLLMVATSISATASWTDYLNPISYLSSAETTQLSMYGTPLVIGTCDTAGPIEVEATAGTPGPTLYASLNAAFTAINAGTHQGIINVEVCGNTTESASAILNSGAVAPASYSSVTVRPVGGSRIIEGTLSTSTVKLNGADNVTIDGRIGGVGSNRDLTIRNNSGAAGAAAVWLASVAAGNGASNNTIRNLEIAGGSDTSSSSNSTFGIIMCGTAITVSSNGTDNDNNSILANRVIKARYGITTRGTTTNLNISPIITDNIVGPASFGTDQIGKVGIFLQADTGAIVSRNTVQSVGCLEPQACTGADRMGIAVGNESWSMAPSTITSDNYTVTKNIVRDVIDENTFSSVGINLATTNGGAATNNLVANNFVYNVRSNGTTPDQAVGLGIAGGHSDRVVFNSISMTGDVDPGAATASDQAGSGIRIANASSASHANLSLRNNSVFMDLSSSSSPGVRFYAISGPSNAYSFGTGGENYNNYYINPSNTQLQTGGLGTTSGSTLTTQFASLALWQSAYMTAQDANSIQLNPNYISATDLHITGAPNESAGVAVAGVTDDIDGDARGATPDIGADEITLAGPGTVQFSATSYTSAEGNNLTITVNRTGGSSGAISVDYATLGGSATPGVCGTDDYVGTTGTLNWADTDVAAKTFTVQICNDTTSPEAEFLNLVLSNPVGTTITGTNPVPLNITDVPAMTYVSSTSTQVTGDAQLGGANQAIIGIQVVTTGSYLPLSVTQLNLSTNGSTSASDIANAKVYYTGTTNAFSTGTQFGSTVASPSGAFNVTGTQALVAGTNYFWLAYDIAPAATVDNFVDAEVSSITVGSVQTPTVTAPAGNRQIKAVVTIPGANTNTGSQRYPLATYYGFQRSAAIYTAAELGLTSGSTIQNMCWYVNSSSSPGTAPTKIYMKTVSNATFAAATTVATEEAGATLAYSGTPSLTYTANTWECIALTTPFVYTGNNLQVLVETDQGTSGNEASTAKQFRYSTAVSAHQFWENDTSAPTGVSTTWSVGGISSNRPNIQFNYAPPVVAPGNLQLSASSYSGNEGTTLPIVINRVGGSAGAVTANLTLTDGTATGAIACGAGIDFQNFGGPNLVSFADGETTKTVFVTLCSDSDIDPGETFTATLSNFTGGAGAGSPISATVTIGDVPPPFNGTYNVGSGETYTSLTNSGGIFEAINLSGATGNLTINITSDLSGETGTNWLNQIAGGYTVLIKPSGGVRTITSTASAQGLITLNGADNVTIDGSLSGGSDRSLNLIGTNASGSSNWVVGLISGGPGLGPVNNTIKNTTIQNAATHSTSSTLLNFCIYAGAFSNSSSDIDNLTIENNQIQRCSMGIQAFGFTGATMDNLVIRDNTLGGSAPADYLGRYGINTGTATNATITGNTIRNVNMGVAAISAVNNATGIALGTNFVNSSVTRNNITNIAYTGTSGYGGKGIDISTGSATSNLTIANNFISNIRGDGWSALDTDAIVGMRIGATTGGVSIYNNSVNLGSGTFAGNSSGTRSAAFFAVSGASALNVRNNIFASNLDNTAVTTDKTYAIATTATTNTLFTAIDYNDYFIVPVSGTTGGFVGLLNAVDRADLAAWQTASGQDVASISQDPAFTSSTDLHLQVTSPTVSAGVPIAGVTVDYDGDPRPSLSPDMGADEIVQSEGGTFPAGSFYNASLIVGNTLAGDVSITNRLYLLGVVNAGSNTVSLGCNATVAGAGPVTYINGAVRKDYCATGAFDFPVGDGGYSPVSANVTTLTTNPSSLLVRPFDQFLAGFDQTQSISRNWQIEETGDLTADLLFTYLDGDVNGNESDYRVWRRQGDGTMTNLCSGGPCVDTGLNTLTVSGVTDFSRWTGSGPLAPSSSAASISGRVTTANGQGIRGAAIVITGNNLPTPIIVKTGSLGYFQVDNLDTGNTYVVTVVSKRFTFAQPSRVMILTDNISDADFVANPLE